jgi:hypothetical protein
MIKKLLFIFLPALAAFNCELNAQCSSTMSYDLIVSTQVVIPASSSMSYTGAYVCPTGQLIDSMPCCTRFVHVDSGGVYKVGPSAYGTLYLKNLAVFDGQNTSMTWQIFAEPGAVILNYSGTVISCVTVTFPAANCLTMIPESTTATPNFLQSDQRLEISFASAQTCGISVYDLSGKEVIASSMENAFTQALDISNLAPGIYVCRITGADGMILSRKIVIGE